MLTKRNIAKFAARTIVSVSATKASAHLIIDHTDAEPDDIAVRAGTLVLGEIVASKAEDHTNALVDKLADRIIAYKLKKTTK